MTRLAAARMASYLTTPFARGADLLDLTFQGGENSSLNAAIDSYDFAEHVARFDRPPQPRYVLTLLRDVPSPLSVTFDFEDRTPNQPVVTATTPPLTITAGALAHDSFVIDLIAAAGGALHDGLDSRILKVHVAPGVAAGTVSDSFRITALLGTMAKVLWVLSTERAHIRRQLERTTDQRHLPHATGFSLDLIGNDLGVPRFPPLPNSPDPATVALYHLDEPAGGAAAADIMANYGGVGHAAVNAGGIARAGEPGRFGTGYAFRDSNAALVIAPDAQFDLSATDSFTAEAFVKPESTSTLIGHVLMKHTDPTDATKPGWVLSISPFNTRSLAL